MNREKGVCVIMEALLNPWLLLVAIVFGAYIAAFLLVVFGVIAFVRAVRRWGQRGSGVCAICGIVTVICGVGSGAIWRRNLGAYSFSNVVWFYRPDGFHMRT